MRSLTDNPMGTGTMPDGEHYLNATFGREMQATGGPAHTQLARVQREARQAWTTGFGAHRKLRDDPTRTADARLLDSAKMMRKAMAPVVEGWGAARAQAVAEIEERRTRMARTLRPTDAVQALQDSEMRRFLLTATNDVRRQLVAEARKAGDVDTVRAIAGAAPYLSGVDADTHATLRNEYLSVAATADWTEVAALEEGLKTAEAAVGQLQRHANHYIDWRRVSQIENLKFEEAA